MMSRKDDTGRLERLLDQALGLSEVGTAFAWQCDLLRMFLSGRIVRAVDVPTGLGKTAVMAIWLVARGEGAPLPRRLVYVVDRRAVVDQATEIAQQLRQFVDDASAEFRDKLGLVAERSLPVSTLRGRFIDNREWLEDPSAPAIIVGTVDMIGSRLLFEGYGVSRKMRPYHSGLLGTDTLVVLDESHLVPPFELMLQTLVADRATFGPAGKLSTIIPPFQLIALSATGRHSSENVIGLTEKDFEHTVAKKRLAAAKRVTFREFDDPKTLANQLAAEAWALTDGGNKSSRIIVFSNSREVAEKSRQAVEQYAKGDKKEGIEQVEIDTQLFVGARRVREREDAANWLAEHGFLAGSKAEVARPAFVFATSAGEVGVDLDADHMVCDLVAWERMVQRLGRVNRRGDGDAEIRVMIPALIRPAEALRKKSDQRSKKETEAIAEYETVRAWKKALTLLPSDRGGLDASPGAIRRLKLQATAEGALRDRIEVVYRGTPWQSMMTIATGFAPNLQEVLTAATTLPPLRPALTRPVVDAWSMTALEKHTGRPLVAPWLRGWIDDQPQTTVLWRRYLPLRNGKAVTRVEMREFFEAAPPHLVETLETETDRVLKWAIKRADSLLKDVIKAKTTAVTDETPDEAQILRGDSVVGVILGRDLDIIDDLLLSDFVFDSDDQKRNKRDRDNLERKLFGNTLVLDRRFAGLSDGGLLEMDVKRAKEPPLTGDDGWLGGDIDDRRGAQEPIPPFRVRKSHDDSKSAEPEWQRCYSFPSAVTEEGEPTHFLIIDKWKHSGASEDGRSAGHLQKIATHQDRAERKAKRLAERLKLPPDYARMLRIVARLHDEGKRAERWQRAFSAPPNGIAYAKTPGPIKFKLLGGYRHEFGSLPALEGDDEFMSLDEDMKELARHLVVSHHGFGRPVIRVDGCDDAPPSALDERARDVALRFARLQEQWGPWGLAWWESLLRSVDQQASRDNELDDNPNETRANNG